MLKTRSFRYTEGRTVDEDAETLAVAAANKWLAQEGLSASDVQVSASYERGRSLGEPGTFTLILAYDDAPRASQANLYRQAAEILTLGTQLEAVFPALLHIYTNLYDDDTYTLAAWTQARKALGRATSQRRRYRSDDAAVEEVCYSLDGLRTGYAHCFGCTPSGADEPWRALFRSLHELPWVCATGHLIAKDDADEEVEDA